MIKKFFFFLPLILVLGISIYAQNQRLADSLINHLDSHPNIEDSVKYLVLNKIAEETTNPSQSVYYATEAYKIAIRENDYNKLGASSFVLGAAYKAQGKLVLALEKYIESEQYYIEAENIKGQATVYSYLASLYSVQNDYAKANYYFDKTITIFTENKDTTSLAIVLQNKGNAFRKIGEHDSALVYFNESLELFRYKKIDLGVAYNLGNIGLVYAAKSDFSRAEENLNKALQILEKYSDSYAIADFSIHMAESYLKNGNTKEALPLVHRGLALALNDGLQEQIRDASLLLSRIYAQTKDYEKAYHHHAQYIAYRDSISNEEVIRRMADLRTDFEVSQKQAEIDLLNQKRERNYILGLALLIFTLLLTVLAIVLYRSNRAKRAANKLLHAQNNRLELQHNKLEKLNNTKDRFFSIISHDLRGPVNAFNGISELIKYYISHNEMGQLREVSEYIDKSARQLTSLLDNLLDWSVKQQGAFPFRPKMIHLNPLLQESIDIFRVAAHAKKISLQLNVEEEIHLFADRNSLMTILRNLLNNALKFTGKDGLVTVSAYTENGFAKINVIDTGIGIPEEKVESLFLLKEKSVSQGTAGEKGLGIGLNLVHEFTQMNKGKLFATSEVGAGSIFTVKLPLLPSPQTKDRHQLVSQENEN